MSDVVTGYKYFMKLHMGLCRGPVDRLSEIRVGDRKAWPLAGQIPLSGSSSVQPIDAPNLFGGDSKEGGIVGKMDLMMGEETQSVNPRLAALLGSFVSAFRGMVTIFYDGMIASLNPYPKAWRFRVQRAAFGWDGAVFYPEKAKIIHTLWEPEEEGGPDVAHIIWGMNPAHIIWECITNRDWGRGLSSEMIDVDSFTAAADTLYAENFGLCFKWTRDTGIDAFVQIVADHIGAVIFTSRITGKITLRLIRNDYTLESLSTVTTKTGVLTVDEDDSTISNQQANEIVVSFICPVGGGGQRQIRVQNLATIQASGSINSKKVEYVGIPTPELAARVAQRDLRIHGFAYRRMSFTFDRRAYALEPGSVFIFEDLARGIQSIVLRVGKIEDAPDGKIRVTTVQDVFGLAATAFVDGVGSGGGGGSVTPVSGTNESLQEASYLDLLWNLGAAATAAVTEDETYVQFQAGRPTSVYSPNFDMRASTTLTLAAHGIGEWMPMGTLGADIAANTTAIPVLPHSLPALASDWNNAESAAMLIGDELVRIVSVNFDTLVVTVARGCGDTSPKAHLQGAAVFLPTLGGGMDHTVYVPSQTVYGKFLTNVSGGQLTEAAAPLHQLTVTGRHIRPYPPAKVLNVLGGTLQGGTGTFTCSGGNIVEFTTSWSHRNRLSQSDVLLGFLDNGVTPEAGTTYTVKVRAPSGELKRTVTGLAASWSYSLANLTTDGFAFHRSSFKLEFSAQRDTYDSWTAYKIGLLALRPDLPDSFGPLYYWRVYITRTNDQVSEDDPTGSANHRVTIRELTMTDIPGSANQATGGTAIAVGTAASSAAANAFDSSSATAWVSEDKVASAYMVPVAIGYQFTVPQSVVNEVGITIGDSVAEAPVNFLVQFSEDGVTWHTRWVVYDAEWKSPGQTRKFVRPDY